MEFWGVEVKSGEPFIVIPGEGKVLHLSQACLGEVKKDKSNDSVCIFVDIEDKKLVLGTLNPEKLPQQVFDLVFDKEFQLSHNSKSGSVYFYGYKAPNPYDDSEDDEFDSEDDIPLHIENNGRQETQAKQVKPAAAETANAKQTAKIEEPKKDVKPETDDSDEDSEDDDDESDSDSGPDVTTSPGVFDSDEDDESSDDDEDSDEEEDATPKKMEVETNNKKRPNEPATKTPGPDKKAKFITPKKTGSTDGKKGGAHVDTPHPSKPAGKNTANSKSTPKSEGSHTCQPCKRSFKSEGALDSHTKAKHSAGK